MVGFVHCYHCLEVDTITSTVSDDVKAVSFTLARLIKGWPDCPDQTHSFTSGEHVRNIWGFSNLLQHINIL